MNPFELKKELEKQLKWFFRITYDRQLVRIRGNREDLLGQLEQLRLSLQETFMESVKSILELATSAKSLWFCKSAQERKDFLNMILSNPVLEGCKCAI